MNDSQINKSEEKCECGLPQDAGCHERTGNYWDDIERIAVHNDLMHLKFMEKLWEAKANDYAQ